MEVNGDFMALICKLADIRWTERNKHPKHYLEQLDNMDIRKIIENHSNIDEDLVVYAKKIDGRFFSSSDAVLLELTEEEQDMNTDKIAASKCPGLSYFLEMFLIKEMMEDFENVEPTKNNEQKIETIIHYAEFDA